ncbi:MAG: DUF998 domain-containing protein [Candidatus Thorarchaeota archaeon]|nr:MAG: DUF998 domain-containing protein [Candidatus Thorarchaeota archaeon]
MLSPIIYTVMWILGGILQEDYSHVRDDVSSLLAVDAPNKQLFDKFLITSSVLLFVFYSGLHWGVNNGEGSIVGPVLFLTSSILGILVALFFPLDAGGEIVTTRGKMHLVLVMISGILTIAGMVALWFRLESVADWSAFASFSLITSIVALILVVFSGISVKTNFMGLVERVAVSTYQVYYFVLALMVFLFN